MYSNSNSSNVSCVENNNLCTLQMNIKNMKNTIFDIKKYKKEVPVKKTKPLEIRKEEVLAIRNRFPTKIPVIVQRFCKETYLPQLDKSKFLVPQEITMSQFQTIIRNRMRMNQNQTLYLLVNNRSMLSLSLTLSEVYTEHAGLDGFLYVTYASQEVFGSDFAQKMHASNSAHDCFGSNPTEACFGPNFSQIPEETEHLERFEDVDNLNQNVNTYLDVSKKNHNISEFLNATKSGKNRVIIKYS